MVIKKYTAPTITEALAKVRDELGTEAIILTTRSNRKGGIFDFVGKSFVEVTAAVDENPLEKTGNGSEPGIRSSVHAISSDAVKNQPAGPASYKSADARRLRDVISKELEHRANLEGVIGDINELKRSVKSLADSALTGEMAGLPSHLADLLVKMQDSGLEDKIAKRITRQLLNELNGVELADPTIILDRAVQLLRSSMGNIHPVMFAGAKPRIVAFIGPTGTGKTTTIAKLATEFSLNMDKNVSVLSIDTKRIDAIGQLKSYCRIIKIPLHVAYTPDELPSIMPKLMNSDITLVDTPGSGPYDKQQMFEMVEFLQKLVPQEVHLTMSVTTSFLEMTRTLENFGTLKPNRLLYTKLDETKHYGPMFSFSIISEKPMSYVTFGQNVPGDFSLADPESLLRESLDKKAEGTKAEGKRNWK